MMQLAAPNGYAFLGYVCAHRIVAGSVVCDVEVWREITEVIDERLHTGAPILTLTTGATAMHVRPEARLLICAHVTPAPCERHNTPAPLPGLPDASPIPEGKR
ncbi:hypothetical protein [Streptomyces sp. NPDC058603]|uniref:hypothetical protein n=1 Tax=Streptomyces sp. NPDC058603 TaxID=3346551 RepID=UPI00365D7FC4